MLCMYFDVRRNTCPAATLNTKTWSEGRRCPCVAPYEARGDVVITVGKSTPMPFTFHELYHGKVERYRRSSGRPTVSQKTLA